MDTGELAWVDWLRQRQRAHPAVRVGIGDDMAVLDAGATTLLVSSDMLLDGVHFDTRRDDLFHIGRKAAACGLSDCAAMAVKPVALTVSLAMPGDLDPERAKQLYEGMASMAAEFDTAIVGGDTTRWDHPLAIDVAVTAEPYDGIQPVTRSQAKVGDVICITGELGGSRLGRHLDFQPRVHEARRLAEHFGDSLHAMMDISDGLSLDLWRMCQASGVGAGLDEACIQQVVSEAARQAAGQDGKPSIEHALSDGEDFELLIAVAGEIDAAPLKLFRVGEITAEGFCFRRDDGTIEPLAPKGYIH